MRSNQLPSIDLMQFTSSPRVTKRETDGGRKSAYHAAILSGKNDSGLWNLSTVEQFVSSFLTSAGSDFTLHPECTRSQQDLTLTKANKLTCMPR